MTLTTFRWDGGDVSGAWNRPQGPARAALVLAHGAGHGMDTRLLIEIGEPLAAQGVAVLRFNFPYMEAGRRGPDPQPKLEACYRAVAGAVAEEFERPFLGGKSMGDRIASHIVANGFPASGLVFLGYPLHPPGSRGASAMLIFGRLARRCSFSKGRGTRSQRLSCYTTPLRGCHPRSLSKSRGAIIRLR